MKRYRPNGCTGRGLEQCGHCLRYTASPEPYRCMVDPDIEDGHCRDQVLGQPVAFALVKPLEQSTMTPATATRSAATLAAG